MRLVCVFCKSLVHWNLSVVHGIKESGTSMLGYALDCRPPYIYEWLKNIMDYGVGLGQVGIHLRSQAKPAV